MHLNSFCLVSFMLYSVIVVSVHSASFMGQCIWVNMDKIIIICLYLKMLASFSLKMNSN